MRLCIEEECVKFGIYLSVGRLWTVIVPVSEGATG